MVLMKNVRKCCNFKKNKAKRRTILIFFYVWKHTIGIFSHRFACITLIINTSNFMETLFATPKVAIKKVNPDAIFVAPPHPGKEDLPLHDLGQPRAITAPLTNPRLSYYGGPLLANVEVYTIFWGAHWTTAPLNALMTQINTFFNAILVSPMIDQLAEYSIAGFNIGHGHLIGSKAISTGAPTAGVTDTAIRTQLKAWIKAGIVPPQNANTLYFIYTEPNISVVMGGHKSCASFCGYHNSITCELFGRDDGC
jgi:hypothetical protein